MSGERPCTVPQVWAGRDVRIGARILCLHGGGTNAAIMKLQTAKLRAQLRPDFSFDFIEVL